MRTLLVMKIISSLIVVNSDELEFLTKALILIWPSALLFFFFLLLSFPHSLPHSPSQHPNDPNTEPIRNIPTPNPFATSQHRTHSQRSLLSIPIRDDLIESFTVSAKSFAVLVAFACSSSLLLAIVAFTIAAFARRRRWSLLVVARACSSSLKLARRHQSNPSDISAPSHTDALAPFCRFSSHGPSTSTYTDCSPSLRRLKPQQPFGFHFNRWPFAFPSNFFFFP